MLQPTRPRPHTLTAPLRHPKARIRHWGSHFRISLAKTLLAPFFLLAYRLGGTKFIQGSFRLLPSQWLIFVSHLIGWRSPTKRSSAATCSSRISIRLA